MKTNSTDIRRVHTKTTIRNGERKEDVIWGDVRTVYVTINPYVEGWGGEVPDQMNDGSHGKRTLFRPEKAHLEWRRNTQWGWSGASGQGWKRGGADEWVLVAAQITGTNIRKDGSLGVLTDTTALYANGDGWGVNSLTAATPPQWFADLIEQHDPAKTGSPLDNEPKG
jgi:hypothetical protein